MEILCCYEIVVPMLLKAGFSMKEIHTFPVDNRPWPLGLAAMFYVITMPVSPSNVSVDLIVKK
jgi:hypothetical protein